MSAELKNLKALEIEDGYLINSWHWLAGLFDAEGCISVLPTYPGLRLVISQKQRPMIDWVFSSCCLQE